MDHTDESPDERLPDCAALDSVNNTVTLPSPRDHNYNHNTAAAQSAGHGAQNIQRQQPLIHHAYFPLSLRPRTVARSGVTASPSAVNQAQDAASSPPGLPVHYEETAPEPLSPTNAVSTPQHLTLDEEQHAQDTRSMRSRSSELIDDRTIRARPASSRHRSRSPTLATQPLSYRDRSPARRQGGSTLNPSAESEPARASNEVGDQDMADADVEDKPLRVADLQKEKNKDAVCVHCWLKELPCDHQWPCKECKARGKACAYIACPLQGCALNVKCPAYHQHKKLPEEYRKYPLLLLFISILLPLLP
ncbi:hypothetical protein KCU65_g1954, partial [Aureobasidium melanogenum]